LSQKEFFFYQIGKKIFFIFKMKRKFGNEFSEEESEEIDEVFVCNYGVSDIQQLAMKYLENDSTFFYNNTKIIQKFVPENNAILVNLPLR
jgi:hypothetical protein